MDLIKEEIEIRALKRFGDYEFLNATITLIIIRLKN